jgi:hypothetical protein
MMNGLDDLIASREPRSLADQARVDQSAELVRANLEAMGINTRDPATMRGVLGGIVLMSWIHRDLGGQLTGGTIGATIMNVVELQPRQS